MNETFTLRTDASDTGVGAVLLQELDNELFPVSFASKKLLPRETKYFTIERECLALVWAVNKFYVYLYGKPFILEVDHYPLTYMNYAKHKNSRIMRWALCLQEFRFIIKAVKGKENYGADYLSRCGE